MSKKEIQKERDEQSMKKTELSHEKRIEELQAQIDFEITRLDRLRNEERHIEARLKSTEIAEAGVKVRRDEAQEYIDQEKIQITKRKIEADRLESDSKKRLAEADRILKEAQEKIKKAEEIWNEDAKLSNEITKKIAEEKTLKSIREIEEKSLEEKAKILARQNQSVKEAEQSNQKKLEHLNQIEKSLNAREENLTAQARKNEEVLIGAKALKLQAEQQMIEAREKVEAGQLSVDRQWNEIEIQKKKQKVERLKIEKLIEEKELAEELKKLEKK